MLIWKQKIFVIIFSFLALFACASLPQMAFARGLVPCGGYTNNEGTQREPPCDLRFAFVMLAMVTNWLIASAGVYAVYEVVNNGFWLVASMGNEEDITKRKSGLQSAVIGFVFVLMAYIFINTAVNGILLNGNPDLRIDITNPYNYLQKN